MHSIVLGDIAQFLVERVFCIHKVVGSSPVISIFNIYGLLLFINNLDLRVVLNIYYYYYEERFRER
jgi:hypothetical protein